MGTRETEMPQLPQSHISSSSRDLPHSQGEPGRRKSTGREENVWATGQRSSSVERWAEEEARKEQSGKERSTSAAASAGSYLDQPFFTQWEVGHARPYICPPHVGRQWVGWGFWFFFLILKDNISSSSPTAEEKRTRLVSDCMFSHYEDKFLINGISVDFCWEKNMILFLKLLLFLLAHCTHWISGSASILLLFMLLHTLEAAWKTQIQTPEALRSAGAHVHWEMQHAVRWSAKEATLTIWKREHFSY